MPPLLVPVTAVAAVVRIPVLFDDDDDDDDDDAEEEVFLFLFLVYCISIIFPIFLNVELLQSKKKKTSSVGTRRPFVRSYPAVTDCDTDADIVGTLVMLILYCVQAKLL